MDSREARFETVCRLLNEMLEARTNTPATLEVDEDEIDALVAALGYYRETIDPSSGDVITKAEFRCPSCGNCAEFRGQDDQVSTEQTHSSVGVEVINIHGIAQCDECQMQLRVTRFQPIKLDGFDENEWNDLYEEAYQRRENVVKVEPRTS